jgi:NAD(P)-dependent dehydrogenase (short-subunit alcohol dehydrogenase family)
MQFDGILAGKIAVVTGGSRGLGRGIAAVLAEAGAAVYATGRTIAQANLPDTVTRLSCDHTDDDQVAGVFERIRAEHGRLDVLVNAAWSGYERMVEGGQFTWPLPFWEQPVWRWHAMIDAGVRAAFIASQHAARLMVPARRGLIVHLSSWAARKRLGNTIYGVSKAATDKMASDMAVELAALDVAVVSLYPGLVRTEAVMAFAAFMDLSNSESPEFTGRAVAALAADAGVQRRTGDVLVVASLAAEYGFTDIDGKRPQPLTLEQM